MKKRISGAPTGRIGVVWKVAVVGDDIAIHFSQAFGHDCIRELRQDFFKRAAALGFFRIRKDAIRKIWIAASHQHQITRELAIGGQRAGGLERGVIAIVAIREMRARKWW